VQEAPEPDFFDHLHQMCAQLIPNVLPHLESQGDLHFPSVEELEIGEALDFVKWKPFGKTLY